MRKEEAIDLIKQKRIAEWNAYREAHPNWIPDLSNINLSNFPLVNENKAFDLSRANLCGSIFTYKYDPYSRQQSRGSGYLYNTTVSVKLESAMINFKTTFPNNFNPVELGAIFISDTDPRGNSNSPTVFISYAWVNGDVIHAIDQWLRNKNIKTKLDKRDFFAGSRIRDEIMRTMQECDVNLIFYSEQSKDKPWTQFEQEFAKDLEMNAKLEGKTPPRIIYIVLDDTPLPSISDKQRLAIMAKGKRFELVCEEIYHHILQIPRTSEQIDLNKWKEYQF